MTRNLTGRFAFPSVPIAGIGKETSAYLRKCAILAGILLILLIGLSSPLLAETPGEFRPKPIEHPLEKVGATGQKVQPPDTLPLSRAPGIVDPTPPETVALTEPTLHDTELVFNAGWKMIESRRLKVADGSVVAKSNLDVSDWYTATVPGTVLTTLVNQGVYPDPYYGLNNLVIPESLNQQDYWYRTEFLLPKAFANHQLWLNFNGINYYAEIWLNGRYLGHITGAFLRGRFNVTKIAEPDITNVLAVKISPPPDPGIPSEQSAKFGPGDNGGKLCLDGPTFICTEGWDWIPAVRDRDAGLWQDVILRATGPVIIKDPQVVTKLPLPDTSRADVTVDVALSNVSDSVQNGLLEGQFEGVQFEQPVTLRAGETKTVAFAPKDFPQLAVEHPRLWWPNGYGKPELYHLQLAFTLDNKKISDSAALRFGVREISYELGVRMSDGKSQRVEFRPTLVAKGDELVIDHRRSTLDWDGEGRDSVDEVSILPGIGSSPALEPITDKGMGPYLVIKINGRKIFCNGGNWGMDDALKRVSRARLEPYIRLEHDAHLDMIRNWTGQSTSDAFYDLCDEYGILVWNDFWMSTEGWNYSPANSNLFLANVTDTLTRYRNHPCIAIWCGRNEGMPPEALNENIDRLVGELDGTRYYEPNSRLLSLRTSGPWSNERLDDYFTDLDHGFSTEMGASSIPSAEVMRTMMASADLWPPGDVWAYHDFHSKGGGNKIAALGMISQCYGEATNLEDLCRKAQMMNYDTYRAIYEGFNSRLWDDCSGVLVWMSHPSWPSVVWQLYSWDYEPNAAYFGAKKACEPIHIQMNLPDCKIAVINHRFESLTNVAADATIYDLAGREVRQYATNVTAAANARTDVFTLDWPKSDTYFVKLGLRETSGGLLSENFYWHARDDKQLQELNTLPKVALQGRFECRTNANQTIIEGSVTNSGRTPALEVKLTLRNAQTGERILPAYYDSNYVSLMPGESRGFRIECKRTTAKALVSVDGWNIAPGNLEGTTTD